MAIVCYNKYRKYIGHKVSFVFVWKGQNEEKGHKCSIA